jgi:hypothetical protein
MKKILTSITIIIVVSLTTAAIIDFKGDGGSSSSSCSSIFMTCESKCIGTHIYSSADCGKNFYFPDCGCDGLMKDEERQISFNSKQEERLDNFITYVSKLQVENTSELLLTLTRIKRSVKNNHPNEYSQEIERFKHLVEELNRKEVVRIKDWIKQNTPHNKK